MMNKKIEELAAKAGFGPTSNPYERQSFDVNLFAQLLIQECMSHVTWVGKLNTNPIEPINTAHAINKRIAKKFGIKP
jgi:hypothetical protein